ncbi:hypothetical protein WR25_03003 [Diploscapter pachys]|uniref:Uncharacterized protein n=1 Tax=Diploscapter pachys TaxID=2018661 RepID=A0A2A2KUB6_9BILA|nr:hypothetical protein WR25_03003 [Diploscapter pachys]
MDEIEGRNLMCFRVTAAAERCVKVRGEGEEKASREKSLREGETEWDRETFRPRLEKQCRKMRKDKRDSGGATSTNAKDRENRETEACPLTCSMHSAS